MGTEEGTVYVLKWRISAQLTRGILQKLNPSRTFLPVIVRLYFKGFLSETRLGFELGLKYIEGE